MNLAPAFLALLLAASASAQLTLTPDQADSLAAAQKKAKSLSERLKPAAVDPAPVKSLWERLSKEGEQVEMEDGIGNILTRFGRPDARGRFKNVQANLVETPAEFAEPPSDSMFRLAVMRRYFSHLVATSESWEIDEKNATGKMHVWIYKVSLDGRLISVEHQLVPLKPGNDGQLAPYEGELRSYRMSPSDPSVQRRWKRLTKELLSLGRLVEA